MSNYSTEKMDSNKMHELAKINDTELTQIRNKNAIQWTEESIENEAKMGHFSYDCFYVSKLTREGYKEFRQHFKNLGYKVSLFRHYDEYMGKYCTIMW